MKSLYRRFIYKFFCWFFRTSTGLFYRIDNPKIDKRAKSDIASIVVSNHPNTMIDGLLAGLKFAGQLNFLVNTSLFQHPISKAFFLLHFSIPIKRYKDPTLEGFPLQKSFALSNQALNEKKAIYIAVEGASHKGYNLRKIRYGTEKIIVDFLQQSDQPIQLICNAIVYRAPARFRSLVHIKTVSITTYHGEVEEGEITKKLEQVIGNELVIFPELSMEDVDLFFSLLYPTINDNQSWYEEFSTLSECISGNETHVNKVKAFLSFIDNSNIKPGAGLTSKHSKKWAILLFLGFFLYLAVYLFSFIPRFISRLFVPLIGASPEYDATIKVILSPFVYLIYALALAHFLPWSIWYFTPILLLLALSEIFRHQYHWIWSRYQALKKFNRMDLEIQEQFRKSAQEFKSLVA